MISLHQMDIVGLLVPRNLCTFSDMRVFIGGNALSYTNDGIALCNTQHEDRPCRCLKLHLTSCVASISPGQLMMHAASDRAP